MLIIVYSMHDDEECVCVCVYSFILALSTVRESFATGRGIAWSEVDIKEFRGLTDIILFFR